MPNTDASRVFVQEGAYTFARNKLDYVLQAIDTRTSAADCWSTITYTAGKLIDKIEYFGDAGKTQLMIEQTFTRTAGGGGVLYITGILTKFFNANGSEDSRVTTTVTRDSNDCITGCDNVFSTTEDTKL